jgi:hypothetical protein
MPTFCEIVKKWSLHFKNGQKKFHKFFYYQELSIPSILQGQLTKYLLVDPTILILVPIFYKIGKNDPYILTF